MTTSRHCRDLRREQRKSYRPVIALVRLYGNRRAVALDEVRWVIHTLEPARTYNRVNMRADLTGRRLEHGHITLKETRVVHTASGLITGSRRVVTIGLTSPKAQCSALTTAASAMNVDRAMRIVCEQRRGSQHVRAGKGETPSHPQDYIPDRRIVRGCLHPVYTLQGWYRASTMLDTL